MSGDHSALTWGPHLLIASKPFGPGRYLSRPKARDAPTSSRGPDPIPAAFQRDADRDAELADLVDRAQRGDRGAFDQLYERTVGRVYALCARMSDGRDEAEALAQDVYVRAWEKLGSFRGESDFTLWLRRLAINVVLNRRRSDGRRRARVDLGSADELEGATARPLALDERMDLERAIARLPPGARAALVLHDVEGYRHREIAAMSGTAVGTVKAQLHRARRLLREALAR